MFKIAMWSTLSLTCLSSCSYLWGGQDKPGKTPIPLLPPSIKQFLSTMYDRNVCIDLTVCSLSAQDVCLIS